MYTQKVMKVSSTDFDFFVTDVPSDESSLLTKTASSLTSELKYCILHVSEADP